MGSRLPTSDAVIIDLDGTLATVNTFKEYIIFAGRKAMADMRLMTAARIAARVVMRKLRLTSHSSMKWHILSATEPIMSAKRLSEFTRRLESHINPAVMSEIARLKDDGYRVILATAAPESYAERIARLVEADYCLSTPPSSAAGWKECVAEEKKARVIILLNTHGLTAAGIITDHSDDLPLMRIVPGRILLVSPEKETLDAVSAEGLDYKIL
ncbi:MAG: haloacid dehalogenase-like hydrolase [Pseudoflavonifractor sp.]|nr:haloacid dehalogenase-like hydrolase [Pseudoflavonifractor sp.]